VILKLSIKIIFTPERTGGAARTRNWGNWQQAGEKSGNRELGARQDQTAAQTLGTTVTETVTVTVTVAAKESGKSPEGRECRLKLVEKLLVLGTFIN